MQCHGRVTSTPEVLAKLACEPRLGASKDAGAATSSDQRSQRTAAA
jgi:hypothetical protein